MEFKRKTFEELTTQMSDFIKANTNRITDFRVGSKVRTLIEAVAMIMEQYYHRVWQALKDAIEESVFTAFDFPRLPATYAIGEIRFSRSTPAGQPFKIIAGTIVKAGDLSFTLLSDVTLGVGQLSVQGTVQCSKIGSIGNVTAGAINTFTTKPNGIEEVTNLEDFRSGQEEETRDARKLRFRDYLRTRARGTAGAITYGAKEAGAYSMAVVESPLMYCLTTTSTGDTLDMSFQFNNPYDDAFLPFQNSGDMLYIGADTFFDFIHLHFQVASATSGTWQYHAGSNVWKPLITTLDNTSGFKQAGSIKFNIPSDWEILTMVSLSAFWVRFVPSAIPATKPSILYGFSSPPPGYVDLYVQDIDGNSPQSLLENVASQMVEYRGSGITVNVRPTTERIVDVKCYVTINPMFDPEEILPQAVQALQDYLNEFNIQEILYLPYLRYQLENIENGKAILRVLIETPISTIYPRSGERIRPGNLVVEEL